MGTASLNLPVFVIPSRRLMAILASAMHEGAVRVEREWTGEGGVDQGMG